MTVALYLYMGRRGVYKIYEFSLGSYLFIFIFIYFNYFLRSTLIPNYFIGKLGCQICILFVTGN